MGYSSVPFPVTTEYVPILKSTRSKTETLARKLYFDSYYSFVVTDFFEGLHHGHYVPHCSGTAEVGFAGIYRDLSRTTGNSNEFEKI